MASGGNDSRVRIWHVATGDLVALAQSDSYVDVALTFSPDNRCVAGVCHLPVVDQYRVRIWEVATGQPLAILRGNEGMITSAAFSPDGSTLATGSENGAIRLFDVRQRTAEELLAESATWTNLRILDGRVEAVLPFPGVGDDP